MLNRAGKSIAAEYLQATAVVYPTQDLSPADAAGLAMWNKALFDINSEGIEDTIFRCTLIDSSVLPNGF